MADTQGWTEQLIADEAGAVYAVPAEVLAQYRLDDTQLAERARGQRSTDAEVQGYWQGGYVVQPGDNLWQISRRLYGDGRYWVYLFGANVHQIRNPNLIQPGQVLALP
jgi:nucleoid-associated protein YgaU